MKKSSIFRGCTAALLFCASQTMAQQQSTFSGKQAYDPPRKWHGLDLALFFGTYNTSLGTQALNSCTSCSQNVAIGYQALYSLTTNGANTAVGYSAMLGNTGGENTAVGTSTLFVGTGSYNSVLGWAAMTGGASGNASYNTAVGALAFEWAGGESYSTCIGYQAMGQSHAATGYNTAVGANALMGLANESGANGNVGNYNVAVGANAMMNNLNGADNVVVGYEALFNNSSGSFNNASGLLSLYNNTTGFSNVAAGVQALYSNTAGSGNTGIGTAALVSNTTGIDNTAVGASANTGSGALTNAMALGANATVSSSNQVVIGSTSVTSIGGYVQWSNFSDGRFKKNIQQNVPGLAFINKLNPVTYTLDIAGIEARLHRNEPSLPAGAAGAQNKPEDDPVMKQAMQEKAAIVYTGLVAQDVEKTAESVGYVFSGIDKPKNTDESFYGLRYADFVPPLVKAVQELSASSDKKDSVINSLQTQINELRAMVLAQKSSASGASLDQNVPNPFTGSTMIGYSLPKGVTSAQMQITDAMGNLLASFPLSGSGKNTLTANVSGFAAGTYNYSLIVNGKLVGSKQMVSVR